MMQCSTTQGNKPLRAVVLYTSGHIGSTVALNLLDTAPEVEIVGMMRAKPIPVTKKGESTLKKYLHKIGYRFALTLWLQWWVARILIRLSSLLPNSHLALVPIMKIAKRKNIEVVECPNINTPEAAEFIRKHNPDIIISAFFSQLIEKEVLHLPKHGVWNIHPGYLPKYRGALSYFWVLKNNEKKAGVTIHKMDEGIDTGGILERKEFRIPEKATQQQLLVEAALIGARMVQRLVRKLQKNGKLEYIDVSQEPEQYFAMPTEADFNHYRKVRAYYRITDIAKIILVGIKNRRMRKSHSFKLVMKSFL